MITDSLRADTPRSCRNDKMPLPPDPRFVPVRQEKGDVPQSEEAAESSFPLLSPSWSFA